MYLRASTHLQPFLDQLAPHPPLDSGDAGVQRAAIRLSLQPVLASDTSAFKRIRTFVQQLGGTLAFADQLVEPIALLRVEPDHVFLDGNLFPATRFTSVAALPREIQKFPS